MQARFLLGPAGSGKTFRCLAEIRAALAAAPDGAPLLVLAPKQATFQLERQLLADTTLPGYTRLQILSFERLANFILEQFAATPPKVLDEEGRLMVLRALLVQKQGELKLFHATARLPGFAQQLSRLLRELQRHQLSADRLDALARRTETVSLSRKLHDVALLLRAYLAWLRTHGLQDVNCLPDEAANLLRQVRMSPESNPQALRLGGLWLDGFAEMTPQELDLLAALMPDCARATLAFCLDQPPAEVASWLSIWSVVGQTFRRCEQRLSALPGCEVEIVMLGRQPKAGRFANSPVLAHLEASWANPRPDTGAGSSRTGLPDVRVVTCANQEAEAVFIAREILRFVQNGGRFREAAILLRSLDGYDELLPRVLRRFGIPVFLDQRESVAHHPLAELTRCALQLVAFGWQSADWMGALKSGLVLVAEGELDWLENEALAHGWNGPDWLAPLSLEGEEARTKMAERLRQKLVPPFQRLQARLAARQFQITGTELAAELRELWEMLSVSETLQRWNEAALQDSKTPAIHGTVWVQMQEWLDNVARAFPQERMSLREWLPILDAGLSVLTVGVIPPALDQVLMGAIDRSRNPDLQVVFLPGMNESIFPAVPAPAVILTDSERAELEQRNIFLGPTMRQRLGHERYFGYVACTRARQRLVLTCSAINAGGAVLNPSPFIAHLQRVFPELKPEHFSAQPSWGECLHPVELIAPLIQCGIADQASPPLSELVSLTALAPVFLRWQQLHAGRGHPRLSAGVVERLYGPELRVSVHALEDFAACAFKFFVARGLRAGERRQFEADQREWGSFQHELLKEFHRRVAATGKTWRDLTPADARELAGRIGAELIPTYRHGLFATQGADQFTAQLLVEGTQKLVAVLVSWAGQYQFNPHSVEVAFGFEDSLLPAWKLDLSDGHTLWLRGRIDRVDLGRDPSSDSALAVVVDYKSSRHKFDPVKLQHGLQLQLLAYLGLLRHLADPRAAFNASKLVPAGVFYVSLRGQPGSSGTRAGAQAELAEAQWKDYQHLGRFNADFLNSFDNRGVDKGNQFNYRKTRNGGFYANNCDPLPGGEFLRLLDSVEAQLRTTGRAVYAGEVGVAPFQKGKETACERCDYRAICRFDPWVEPYRVLRRAEPGKGAA